MLVVMKTDATPVQIEQVLDAIRHMKLTPHPMPGATRTAIGITGNVGAVDPRTLEVLPGVMELIRVTKPFKLASREMHREDTIITLPLPSGGEGRSNSGSPLPSGGEGLGVRGQALPIVHPSPPTPLPQGARGETSGSPLSPGARGVNIGPGTFTIIAGPCSVENEPMIQKTAEFLVEHGVKLMRAGAYKPRTSPYAFQGMGKEGLDILARVRKRTGIGIVTELMDTDNADAVEEAADIIQIGARNMQNFSLLKRVSLARKPVLLKRGLSATLEELLMAAEYIMAGGNYQVILCERGVRTFSDHSRNTLDLSIIPPAKTLSHLPILVDPSHGTGKRDYVPPMALAGLAAGADGLLIEVHPDPDHAMSDGAQSLTFAGFARLLESLRKLAGVLERKIN